MPQENLGPVRRDSQDVKDNLELAFHTEQQTGTNVRDQRPPYSLSQHRLYVPSHGGFVRRHILTYAVPNGMGMSHGAALGAATRKTITKGRSVILMTKQVFLFGFDVFPGLFGVVSFLTAPDPTYNPQHKHPPSETLTLVQASQEQRSPSPAIPHLCRGITPLGLTICCGRCTHSHSHRPTCTTAAATRDPSAHPAMLKSHSQRGSHGSITFKE